MKLYYGSQKYLLPSLVSPEIMWRNVGIQEMIKRGTWWLS